MNLETFPTAANAAAAAAMAIVGQLTSPGEKHLLVTGGGGPGPVYDRLAAVDLDWSRVTVALSDDRFVELGDPNSNEKMVRDRLLTGHAAAATLVPLTGHGGALDEAARAAESTVAPLAPFDCALLGMGPDGHIASLYSVNADAARWLDPDCDRSVVGVRSAGWSPYVARLSLTARALFDARLILLLIGGEAKRTLIDQIEADPVFSPPAAALLRQTKSPVRVLWSPDSA
jgi:6-phosphogluconolactonase